MDSTLIEVPTEVSAEVLTKVSAEDLTEVSSEICFQTQDNRTKILARRVPWIQPMLRTLIRRFLLAWNRITNDSNDDMLYVVFTFLFSRYNTFFQPDGSSSSVMYLTRPQIPLARNMCTCTKIDCGCVCHAKKKEWKQLVEERKKCGSKNTPRPVFPKDINACRCCIMCLNCMRSLSNFKKGMTRWNERVARTRDAQITARR